MADSSALAQKNINANKQESKKEKMVVKTFKRLLKNKLALFGLVIIVIQVILAAFAPWFATYPPAEQDLVNSELGIGAEGHWLGTDNYGRDVWSRLVFGAKSHCSSGSDPLRLD